MPGMLVPVLALRPLLLLLPDKPVAVRPPFRINPSHRLAPSLACVSQGAGGGVVSSADGRMRRDGDVWGCGCGRQG